MYKRILVPVDGSSTSKKALAAALQMASESGGQVHVVHAIDELAYVGGFEYSAAVIESARKEAAGVLDAAMAAAKKAGVTADSKLIDKAGQRLGNTVAEEALEWNADLVVAGTHGRRGLDRVLLGSGAEQIIRTAPVPVLVIRADEES